jgi:hypothetical protein
MDILSLIGQTLFLLALAYGGWVCLVCAGRYDAENLEADVRASRAAGARSHVEPRPAPRRQARQDMAA